MAHSTSENLRRLEIICATTLLARKISKQKGELKKDDIERIIKVDPDMEVTVICELMRFNIVVKFIPMMQQILNDYNRQIEKQVSNNIISIQL